MEYFTDPTPEEVSSGPTLIGNIINIFWDGDNVFYPAKVIRYDQGANTYWVLYENDATGQEYEENLSKSQWKIWRSTEEEFHKAFPPEINQIAESELNTSVNDISFSSPSNNDKKLKIPSYGAMVLEAVENLNEKEGSSLVAIRKYILSNYKIHQKQTASFNSLTLKAVNRAVAANELEKYKHSFRISSFEKEKRKEAEKRAIREMKEASKRQAFAISMANNRKSLSAEGKGSRKFTPFMIDGNSLSALAMNNNKSLRKELIDSRKKRDLFLKKRIYLFKSFLPQKDYFTKLQEETEAQKAMNKAKQLQAQQEKLAQQQAELIQQQLPQGIEPQQTIDENGNIVVNVEGNELSQQQSSLVESNDNNIKTETQELPLEENNVPNTSMEIDNTLDISAMDTSFIQKDEAEEAADEAVEEIVEEEAQEEIPIVPIPDDEFEEEVDESKLSYSTLEGVPILEKPSILIAELHEHQIVGISWMVHMYKNGMPMILGDQMGLGKTIQTIGFLAYLQNNLNKKGPFLIVVPLSVLSNWLSEIEKFCPSFRAVRFHGPKMERERIKMEEMNDLAEFDIVVTTYEILVSEINFFRRKYVWTSVVIDEGHRLKNEKSQLSEKLRCVPCVSKVILTGTPLQNNLHELWAILYYLYPDIFTVSDPFDKGFDLLRGVIDNRILRRARKMLSVFMLRRIKDQVDIKLPGRREVTLLVSLTDRQVELYKQLLCGLDASTIEVVMREGKEIADINASGTNTTTTSTALTPAKSSSSSNNNDNSGSDADWRKLMNILLQLRKICNHTYLLPGVAPDPYDVTEEIVSGSGKLLMLDRMLPRLKADGHRCLIFSQFTSMLDILEDYCELREYSYVRLDGETNRVKRRLDCRRFNSTNSNLFIFLISTRAGGLGLNLATADTVILYDSDWNPQVDLQAMERAHRIGQKKPVRVFRLVCRGSVEERMVSRAEKKLFLNAMVAERDPDEQLDEQSEADALGIGGSSISKGELASLIRFGANAVIDSENSKSQSINDEELDVFLERTGRDNSNTKPDVKDDPDAFEKAQASIRERNEKLQEVDLRQLGNVVFTKKKPDKKKSLADEQKQILESVTPGKRQRKERIVMMDGKGTGYGGAVPVLADSIEVEKPKQSMDEEEIRGRGRLWSHRMFCTLCGRSDNFTNIVKCAHCPLVFHQTCAEANSVFGKGAGMSICPHHRCGECNRSTASAGGLLFRCCGCLTSYCEDCLPQDEIESVGRCRAFETFGYHSKQAYFIKCPSCCEVEGVKPLGILGDQEDNERMDAKVTEEDANSNEDEENPNDTSFANNTKVLATQQLRIEWVEHLPTPPPSPKPKNKKRKGKDSKKTPSKTPNKKKRTSKGGVVEEEEDNDEEEEEEEEVIVEPPKPEFIFTHPTVPKNCTLLKAINIVINHPIVKILFDLYREQPNSEGKSGDNSIIDSIDLWSEFSAVMTKVENARYRSPAAFINDVKFVIEGKFVKTLSSGKLPSKELKAKTIKLISYLITFFSSSLEPNLSI